MLIDTYLLLEAPDDKLNKLQRFVWQQPLDWLGTGSEVWLTVVWQWAVSWHPRCIVVAPFVTLVSCFRRKEPEKNKDRTKRVWNEPIYTYIAWIIKVWTIHNGARIASAIRTLITLNCWYYWRNWCCYRYLSRTEWCHWSRGCYRREYNLGITVIGSTACSWNTVCGGSSVWLDTWWSTSFIQELLSIYCSDFSLEKYMWYK